MSTDVWSRLAVPFPPEVVKERQGPSYHRPQPCEKERGVCRLAHKMLSYVDARDVATRLDEVVGQEGWTFTCEVVPGTTVVHGRLTLRLGALEVFREDHGYPNSDEDEEPIKAATSDAFKRCAVLFGVGRHLYGDNHAPRPRAQAPRPAPAPAPAPQADSTEPPALTDDDLAHLDDAPAKAAAEPPRCPVHNYLMKPGKKGGWYCTGKTNGEWCKERVA